ncbi:uncharacterized protein EI97DRAFT_78056 [Westerdykella ornata]|uniref:Uncharacterized protein n=1 Tax=Westerdykella ornata TaxID=318751 RepID=A0A6A6JHK2_WESOR|nr:uncharacterized protein EI97DRAFT_78056 [Westerdykella ornata]KAF2275126.1 hypothetical protein EI97DRAFT_78056 [Westerdykella ornata]
MGTAAICNYRPTFSLKLTVVPDGRGPGHGELYKGWWWCPRGAVSSSGFKKSICTPAHHTLCYQRLKRAVHTCEYKETKDTDKDFGITIPGIVHNTSGAHHDRHPTRIATFISTSSSRRLTHTLFYSIELQPTIYIYIASRTTARKHLSPLRHSLTITRLSTTTTTAHRIPKPSLAKAEEEKRQLRHP